MPPRPPCRPVALLHATPPHPEYRRQANLAANNGLERKDLYTANWAGSEYRGSRWNILTLVGALFVLTPVAGLVFAYVTYGTLWG